MVKSINKTHVIIKVCTNDHMKTNFNRESWKSFFATLKINK